MRFLYKFFFKLLGWKVEGQLPKEHKKYILIVAPHTSNWDFMVGLGARAVLEFDPKYAGKKELFVWPFGWLFRRLGGFPVERKESTNFVQTMAEIFRDKEEFILTITPEGTRSYSEKWKTGFYYIAKEAQVPILPVAFDYPTKTVVLGELVFADQNVEDVVDHLHDWYSQYKGKNPENGVRSRK